MKLFAQIRKVDEAKRMVYGRAVQEVVDRVGEIFDYEKSKPYFQEWSKGFYDATDGKSQGNIRAMHGKVSAGIVKQIDFADTEKAIDIAAHINDDQEWKKVLDGNYTGFSIGGSYVGDKITEKVDDKEIRRYVANPSEISIVDSPCIPTARFFEVVKADGAIAKVDFKPAPIEVKGSDDDVAKFGEALNESGLTMADAIAAVQEYAEKLQIAKDDDLLKGDLAKSLIESDSDEARSSNIATEIKAGKSPEQAAAIAYAVQRKHKRAKASGKAVEPVMEKRAPDPLEEAIAEAVRVGALHKRLTDPELTFVDLVKIAQEHLGVDELKPLKDATEVQKAVLGKAKMSAANMDRLQAAHDHIAAMGAQCGEQDADDKATPTGELVKAFGTMESALKAANERIAKLEAQPMPHPILLRAVKKEDVTKKQDSQVQGDFAMFEGKPYEWFIKSSRGEIDWRLSEEKLLQEQSGAAA